MTDRKHPTPGFWITVALVAVLAIVAYPLSVGPVAWLRNHEWIPTSMDEPIEYFYTPLAWIYRTGLQPFRDALDWYGSLWTG